MPSRRSVPNPPPGTRARLYENTHELRTTLRKLMAERGCRTSRDVSARSKGRLNFQTVDAVLSGRVESVRLYTLERLADALSHDLNELIALTTTDQPWTLPTNFDRVPPKLRKQIEHALAEMLRSTGIID